MWRSILILIGGLWTGVAHAQVSNMPQQLQDHLHAIGPVWGQDIQGNNASTLALYTPILRAAPKGGLQVTRDLAYGPDARHRLDIYQPPGASNAPIVVFFHGGAYVRGERNVTEEAYANIATYFGRQGMVGVNATYRLAPSAPWPGAAADVGRVVEWIKQNAASYGGDPNRIYLIGHSAGATHVATYALHPDLRPAEADVAGLILMSGRYRIDPKPDDPNLANVQAYFGSDPGRYATQSMVNHVQDAPRIPTFIVISEYDNPDLDTEGANLFATLCARDRACPRFTRLESHNHLSTVYHFNTADEALGREIVDFIRRGR